MNGGSCGKRMPGKSVEVRGLFLPRDLTVACEVVRLRVQGPATHTAPRSFLPAACVPVSRCPRVQAGFSLDAPKDNACRRISFLCDGTPSILSDGATFGAGETNG